MPIAPNREGALAFSNQSDVILDLDSWDSGGCYIKAFLVRYKQFFDLDWNVAINHQKPPEVRRNERERDSQVK